MEPRSFISNVVSTRINSHQKTNKSDLKNTHQIMTVMAVSMTVMMAVSVTVGLTVCMTVMMTVSMTVTSMRSKECVQYNIHCNG